MRRIVFAAVGVVITLTSASAYVPSATGVAHSDDTIEVIALNAGELGAPCLQPYTDFNCVERSDCADGTTIDGLCSGNGVTCCVPLPDSRCRQAFGECMTRASCTKGTALSGRCPGFDDVACCVQDRRFQVRKLSTSSGPFYSVVSSTSGSMLYKGTSASSMLGLRSFALQDANSGDVLAQSKPRWHFSALWKRKLPIHDITVHASETYPSSHWVLSESPNGRLSLQHVSGLEDEQREAALHTRGFSDETMEGSWGADLRVLSGDKTMLSVDSEGTSKWSVTVHDVTGAGYPTLDPRVAFLVSIISNYRSM